VVGVGMRD